MSYSQIDLKKIKINEEDLKKKPAYDGAPGTYVYSEAKSSSYFDGRRTVIFINGMANDANDHVTAALMLSWVQMCAVRGVFNATAIDGESRFDKIVGISRDLLQCAADKNQFNGISASAPKAIATAAVRDNRLSADVAREVLGRNRAQVTLFNELREEKHRHCEIFAHSQGNIILSNVLQAISAVDGPQAIVGRTINTFGSPVVHWPKGIIKYEHAFTSDPVAFLAGFDSTWTISKVGMPSGGVNPITHAFLEYLLCDPTFLVNRYRWGGLGITFSLDEDGLAAALAAMGKNMSRVHDIFKHLNENHNSDADDVAVRYVSLIKNDPGIVTGLKSNGDLIKLLITILDEGWTSAEEKVAISFLETLKK